MASAQCGGWIPKNTKGGGRPVNNGESIEAHAAAFEVKKSRRRRCAQDKDSSLYTEATDIAPVLEHQIGFHSRDECVRLGAST